MFVRKGYCRFAGKKCRQFMVEGSEKYCKQKKRNNHIDGENEVRNILAPSWCPKKKH